MDPIEFLQTPLEPLPARQQLVAVLLATGILALVIELVRRRRLREEYAWVWIAVSCVLLLLALNGSLVTVVSRWIGAATSTSTLFFGALIFLMLLALQFSVRLSRLTYRYRVLAQRLALLEEEVERQRTAQPPPSEILPLRTPPVAGSGGERQPKEGTA